MNKALLKILLIFFIGLFVILIMWLLLPSILWQEPLASDPVLLVLVPMYILCFVWLYVLQSRFSKINALLFDLCDPEAYVEGIKQLLAKAEKRRQMLSIQTLRINLNAGLQAAGRYQEALASMPDASQFKDNRIGRTLRVVYHHNNFEAFFALGNMDQAQMALAWLNDALGSIQGGGKQAEHFKLLGRMDEAQLAMARGCFDGAEEVMQESVDKAQNNYQRVSSMLELGRIHAHYGRTEQAREAFEYVVAHGNKLHAVTLAKQHLAAMGHA